MSSFIQVGATSASKNYVRDFNLYFENKWATGFATKLNYFNSVITPVNNGVFKSLAENNQLDSTSNYFTSGIDLTLKFSWQNKNVNGNFYNKEDYKNTFKKFPDIAVQWKLADKNLGSEFNFQKIKISFYEKISK